MKRPKPISGNGIPSLVFAIFLFFLHSAFSAPLATINLVNRHADPLRSALVVVPVKKLHLKPEDHFVVVRDGVTSPAQLEDGGGAAENLVFQVDMAPGESAKFTLEKAAEQSPSRVAAIPLPAWESEKFGFRSYGPMLVDLFARQGGAYGLRLASFFDKDNKTSLDYHHPGPLGMDILHINKTLGLAGVFLSDGKSIAIPTDVSMTSRILADGPVRAVVEMKIGPWKSPWGEVTFERVASIAAGQFGTALEDSVSLGKAGKSPLRFGVGLRKEASLERFDDPSRATFMHSFRQDALIGAAGIGLLFTDPAKPSELPEDPDNRYFSIPIGSKLHSVAFGFWSGEEDAPIDQIAAVRAGVVRSEQIRPDVVSVQQDAGE